MQDNRLEQDFHWQGRNDLEDAEMGIRVHHKVGTAPRESDTVTIVGFGTDAGVARNKGRIGAKEAPNKIRKALADMAWHESSSICDLGTIYCHDDELEIAQQQVANSLSQALSNTPVILLGGGHEIAWASYQGLAQHLSKNNHTPKIGIINFDAHFDLRCFEDEHLPIKPSSGTPFLQIQHDCDKRGWPFKYACLGVSRASNTRALFQRAHELDVWYLEDSQMMDNEPKQALNQLQSFIDGCDYLYLTIDLDVFPASTAPGVSAPAAFGVSLERLLPYFKTILANANKLKIADIAEYNPMFDQDSHTAKLAARLCWEIARAMTASNPNNR
ncbi:formimidoylglutamase [Vibrio sp. SCSIO 43136]|uniref:formimidoylglutamase n=1 Tax=Vibrio sp. SCSIO 43136 TaxID=2819101 RepID=UPI0020766644|nr:formimidoylglutamase [Vibrio sp. SCSIO 43136]USD64120.1 formimidoylglutamase [Vibrio sp. SCSIO 43136]